MTSAAETTAIKNVRIHHLLLKINFLIEYRSACSIFC